MILGFEAVLGRILHSYCGCLQINADPRQCQYKPANIDKFWEIFTGDNGEMLRIQLADTYNLSDTQSHELIVKLSQHLFKSFEPSLVIECLGVW